MNRSLRKLLDIGTPGIIAVGLSVLPSVAPQSADAAAPRWKLFQTAYDESDDGPSLGPPTLGSPSYEPATIDTEDTTNTTPMKPPAPPRMFQAPPTSPAQAAVNAKRRSQQPARTQTPSATQIPGEAPPASGAPYPGSAQYPNSSRAKPPARTQAATRSNSKTRSQSPMPARMQSKTAQAMDPPVPSRPPLRSDAPARKQSSVRTQPTEETQTESAYATPDDDATPGIAENYNEVPTVAGEAPRLEPQRSAAQSSAPQRTAPRTTTNWTQSQRSNNRATSTQQTTSPQQPRQPISRPISTPPQPPPSADELTLDAGPSIGDSYNEIPSTESVDATASVEATPGQPAPRMAQPARNQNRPAPAPKRSLNPLSGKFLRQSAEVEYEEPPAVEAEPAVEISPEPRKRWRWNPFARDVASAQLETPEPAQTRSGRFHLKGAPPLEEAPLYSAPAADAPTFEEYSARAAVPVPPEAAAEPPSKGWRFPWSPK